MSKYAVVHVEIPSKDRKKNSKFYADLFGWKLTEYNKLNYTVLDLERVQAAAFRPSTAT